MNEQLINFIQLCLADGVISEKEREVIFRKAKEFGVDEDECEILIDSYTFKVNKTSKNNKSITLKPDRKFVLKKVNKIAPASLNQEKELYKKVDILSEEEKKITFDYNKFFKQLSSINDNIKPISASLKVDFENLKKEFDDGTKHLNEKYINTINQVVSRKFGKTEMVLTESEKISIDNLTPNKKKDYILKNVKWDYTHLSRKIGKKVAFWYLMFVLALITFICIGFTVKKGLLFGLSGQITFGIGIISLFISNALHKKKEEALMNFNNDDIELIIDDVNKSLTNAHEQLELKKKMIENYRALTKYDWAIPPKKIECYTKKEVSEILQLLQIKKRYGHK
jgi:hypothetical protein